jgi:hypothetical protein
MANHYVRPRWIQRETVLDRRIWVYYLIIPELIKEHWNDLIEVRPDERFYAVLNEHVQAYIQKGVAPPDSIRSVVMNVADDVMAEREVVLRAGDYIAMQNFIRG